MNPCRLRLIGVHDARKTKDLGKVAARQVKGENIVEWLTDGLEQMGIREDGDGDPSQPTLDVDVAILAAHVRSVETSMSCGIVLEVRFMQNHQTLALKRCRGSCTRMNWVSGADEINRCLILALQDAVAKVHEHARSVYEASGHAKG